MKKILSIILSVVYSLQSFAAKSTQPEQVLSSGWYSGVKSWWGALSPNMQLGIQLVLLLLVFYAITCFFSCSSCSCGVKCNCKGCKKK